MDDLRWILAIFGIVVVVATYFSGRFEREEWKRDRETASDQSGIPAPEKRAPQIKTQDKSVKHQPEKFHQINRKVSEAVNYEKGVDEASDVSGLEVSITEKDTMDTKSEWEGAVDSARKPLIEDEIVDVEIPAEFSEYGEERRSKSRLKLKPGIEKPVQQGARGSGHEYECGHEHVVCDCG